MDYLEKLLDINIPAHQLRRFLERLPHIEINSRSIQVNSSDFVSIATRSLDGDCYPPPILEETFAKNEITFLFKNSFIHRLENLIHNERDYCKFQYTPKFIDWIILQQEVELILPDTKSSPAIQNILAQFGFSLIQPDGNSSTYIGRWHAPNSPNTYEVDRVGDLYYYRKVEDQRPKSARPWPYHYVIYSSPAMIGFKPLCNLSRIKLILGSLGGIRTTKQKAL